MRDVNLIMKITIILVIGIHTRPFRFIQVLMIDLKSSRS